MVAAQSNIGADLGAPNADQMRAQFEKMPVERRRRFFVRIIFHSVINMTRYLHSLFSAPHCEMAYRLKPLNRHAVNFNINVIM